MPGQGTLSGEWGDSGSEWGPAAELVCDHEGGTMGEQDRTRSTHQSDTHHVVTGER